MKKSSAKLNKVKTLEDKVDFIVDFIQTKIATKDDLDKLSARTSNLEKEVGFVKTAIDNLSKQIKGYHQEMIVLVHRVERMEMWIKKASVKLGIPYEF